MKQRIVSGMRPTGKLHFGHYLGVIKNWVKLQDDYDCNFFVADWHALTTKYDNTEELRQNVINIVSDWLACGIDPQKSTIYVQSLIPEIAELNIYLSMTTPQNWVERDPTLKDMAKIMDIKGNDSQVSSGLLGYPILMSADIMMLNAHFVPVGIDQVAHIEITRDIARRFNNIYKTDFFIEPQPKLTEIPLLCGLDGNKMGKSFNNDIKISDTAEDTQKKIMRGITDRTRIKRDDPGHPDLCEVIYKYWKIFGDESQISDVKCQCEQGTRGCADCKRYLASVINEQFRPIREKREYFANHQDEVEKIIREGSQKVREIACENLKEIRKIIKMY